MTDCVPKETELLTAKGYVPIGALVDQVVSVWSGIEFADAMIHKTGSNERLVRVWFEDGSYLDCSEQHDFYTSDKQHKPATALRGGDKLLSYIHPVITLDSDLSVQKDEAYVAGYATFAGYEDNNRLTLALAASASDKQFKRMVAPSVDLAVNEHGTQIRYEAKSIKSGYAPLRWRTLSRLYWIAGTLDAAGDWLELEGGWWLCLGSTDEQLIREMRRVALECGFVPRIRITDTMNAFMLDSQDANMLISLEMVLAHKKKAARLRKRAQQLIEPVVSDVHPLPWRADVYSAVDSRRKRLVFNGVMVGSGE